MKKTLLWSMLFIFTFILIACNNSSDNVREQGQILDYGYAILEDNKDTSWEVTFESDVSVIIENEEKREELENFMDAINGSESALYNMLLAILIIASAIIVCFIYYKKKVGSFSTKRSTFIVLLFFLISFVLLFVWLNQFVEHIEDVEVHYQNILK